MILFRRLQKLEFVPLYVGQVGKIPMFGRASAISWQNNREISQLDISGR